MVTGWGWRRADLPFLNVMSLTLCHYVIPRSRGTCFSCLKRAFTVNRNGLATETAWQQKPPGVCYPIMVEHTKDFHMNSPRSVIAVVFATIAIICAVVLAQEKNQAQGSTIFDWDGTIANPTSFGSERALFKGPTATLDQLDLHVVTLNPGQSAASSASTRQRRGAGCKRRHARIPHQWRMETSRPRLGDLHRLKPVAWGQKPRLRPGDLSCD